MDITEVFYPNSRAEWRQWLQENHQTKTEIWLRTFRKSSGKFSLPYDDMVEECLCFGWIDGTAKSFDEESAVRRITPRRKKSFLSELNRQRIWKLQRLGMMTEAGIAPVRDQIGSPDDPFEIPEWIAQQLQAEMKIWEQFQQFPYLYQRLKMRWITEAGPSRQDEMQKRLNYFIKMTAQGKMYGTRPEV
ncbi:MAG: YdeI/OmpD-associated family protein [Saprospiraceae bacterium]|nr:YdeI/OmpD-associated family protein [Saprospiraceae bacterium]